VQNFLNAPCILFRNRNLCFIKGFRQYKVHADICVGSLEREHQMNVELSKTAIFSTFACHIFGTFRVEANIIMLHHEVPCGLSATPKCVTLNDLEMSLLL